MDLSFIRWLVVGLAMIAVCGSNVDGQDFVPVNIWPSPQLFGDQSLYLLQHRRQD